MLKFIWCCYTANSFARLIKSLIKWNGSVYTDCTISVSHSYWSYWFMHRDMVTLVKVMVILVYRCGYTSVGCVNTGVVCGNTGVGWGETSIDCGNPSVNCRLW